MVYIANHGGIQTVTFDKLQNIKKKSMALWNIFLKQKNMEKKYQRFFLPVSLNFNKNNENLVGDREI